MFKKAPNFNVLSEIGLGMVTKNLITGLVDLIAIPKILVVSTNVDGLTTEVRFKSNTVFPSI